MTCYSRLYFIFMTKHDIRNYISANPHWLTGLIDGEGSFGVSVSERVGKAGKIVYSASTTFYLGLNGRERYVLEGIQEYFDCGYITTAGVKSGFFFLIKFELMVLYLLVLFLFWMHTLCALLNAQTMRISAQLFT